MPLLPRFDPGPSLAGWPRAAGLADAAAERALLEATLCAELGVAHAVAVPSARVGISRLLIALGVRAGDEVIVGAFNYPPLVQRMREAGIVVTFADVDPATLALDPASVGARVTTRTRAVVVTHAFGRVAPVDALAEAAPGIPLVQDCAQAIGARVSLRGGAGVVSFGPTKPLPSIGGGAVLTFDAQLAARVRTLQASDSPPLQAQGLRWLRAGMVAAAAKLTVPAALAGLVPPEWLVDRPGESLVRRPWHEAELAASEARRIRLQVPWLRSLLDARRALFGALAEVARQGSHWIEPRPGDHPWALLLRVPSAARAAHTLRAHGIDAVSGELSDLGDGRLAGARTLERTLLRLPVRLGASRWTIETLRRALELVESP